MYSRHLNICKHPWEDLMSFYRDSLSITSITSLDIRIRMCPRPMAVVTQDFAWDLELSSTQSLVCHGGKMARTKGLLTSTVRPVYISARLTSKLVNIPGPLCSC
jgi:hypothetical protein